jgi:hypothetical protein
MARIIRIKNKDQNFSFIICVIRAIRGLQFHLRIRRVRCFVVNGLVVKSEASPQPSSLRPVARNRIIHKAYQHFIPGLFAPVYELR